MKITEVFWGVYIAKIEFESHLLRHIIALFLDGKVRFFSPNFLVDPHAPVG